jgi:pyruvate dehydrogenase E2 component (dihydrolipoamide acetyltransferase)
MPRLSDTMEEGTIAQWLVAEGATVERGTVIAEIETDKAVMDLEAYDGGVLEKILVQVGETVPIGEKIAIIGDGSGSSGAGANGSAPTAESGGDDDVRGSADEEETGQEAAGEADQEGGAEEEAGGESGEDESVEDAAPAPSPQGQPPAEPETASDHPLKASPVVRSLARQHNIDLGTVTGTGPGGRIIRADVEGLIAAGPAAAGEPARATSSEKQAPAKPAAAPGAPTVSAAPSTSGAEDVRVPLSRIRKITAARLSEAALVPAFQLTTVLDATKLGELRAEINAHLGDSGVKISVTDLLVRAAAITLRAHPEANAAFDGDAIIRRGHVNVGVAVALDDGLIVPVIKDADQKSVSEISAEAKDLAKRARTGKLMPDEFTGGTFTISNLGMFGIDSFTAVLNPPEAAILAVGATVDEPVVEGGEVVVRARTRLTLTVDHRVLDGAMGAAFLRDLTDLLAKPLRILV